jgi:hypothetical protein
MKFYAPLLVIFITIVSAPMITSSASASSDFTFAAAGDHAQDINTNTTLRRLGSSGLSFYLALGDLSYTSIGEEKLWCNIVKSYMGSNFPFELVSGFHDDGLEAPPNDSGLIDNFVNCLPDRIGVTGVYGKEYYFDYPSVSPLARIMMISPALNFTNGGYYSYAQGSQHYQWLSDRIDGARASGIPWVIVAMHKPCISSGLYPTCVAGRDLMNLLIQKKVDLVLQAHDHNYQRSKQLSCASVEQFVSSCVTNDGSSGTYTKGVGTTFVIAGTFGQEFYAINYTNPNIEYFAKVAGNNTLGLGHGFVKYTVTPDEIQAKTDLSGSFSDTFRIVKPGITETILLFVKDNAVFVSLSVAPIAAWVTIIIVRRRKERRLIHREFQEAFTNKVSLRANWETGDLPCFRAETQARIQSTH